METEIKSYWDRIKSLLKEQNKTQDELCAYCDIRPQTFRNRMSINGSSSVFEAQKIAEYLNTSIDYLVSGKSCTERYKTAFEELKKKNKDIENILKELSTT